MELQKGDAGQERQAIRLLNVANIVEVSEEKVGGSRIAYDAHAGKVLVYKVRESLQELWDQTRG
jgi:hypothetical protein